MSYLPNRMGRILRAKPPEQMPDRSRANFLELRKHEVRSAPVRWARISPVVAPLRVATPCYPTEQRTLLGRDICTPKRCHHAALGDLEPSSAGRLLPRTSENTCSPKSGE